MGELWWIALGLLAGAYIWHKGFRDKVNGYVKGFFNKNKKRS